MKNNDRLMSLDALRGFDMFFIMGLSGLIVNLCALFPCGFSEMLSEQMGHVAWNGLRHHDTIFPLFLFLAGVSFPFSFAKQRERIFAWLVCWGVEVWLGRLQHFCLLTLVFAREQLYRLRYWSVMQLFHAM